MLRHEGHLLTSEQRVKWVSLFLPRTRNSEQASINNCCYWQNAHANVEPDTQKHSSFGEFRLVV